jgi:hypothetical protein
MKKLIPIAIGVALLLAVGAAWAATSGPSTTDAVDTVETTQTQTSTAPAPGATTTVAAGRAGSVTYGTTGQGLAVESVAPARGWSYVVTADGGGEIEVTFRKAGTRVDFHAELEDGDVEIRVRTRTVSGATTTSSPERTSTTDGNVTSTSSGDVTGTSSGATDVTSTSFDDNAGDDNGGDDNGGDNSGSGRGGGDDD